MAAPNYRQAKRQKEIARKAQQQVKQQRRSERAGTANAAPGQDESPAAPAGTQDKADAGAIS